MFSEDICRRLAVNLPSPLAIVSRLPLSRKPNGLIATPKNSFAFARKIEHGICVSVRGGFTVCPSETNALNFVEFSRQRATSRCRGGVFVRLPLRPGPISNTKALGISEGEAARNI